MVKIGDSKRYVDSTGLKHVNKIVHISEFNYVSRVENSTIIDGIDNIENKLLDYIGFGDADDNYFYIIHNKAIIDVDKMYRKIYSNLLKDIKGFEFNGFYEAYCIKDIYFCANMNQINKYYKDQEFGDIYLDFHRENV